MNESIASLARKRVRSITGIVLALFWQLFVTPQLCGQSAPLSQATTQPQERESFLDRIVHLEPKLVTEIPETPGWEEQLDLTVRRVSVGDAELYVEEEGSGVPIVLLHAGPGGTHHGFHPWFGRARDYARVIYYDQRGCGLSDYEPGESGYSVDQAVEDLDALRAALGIDEWVLVGFSYGGFLAQYYTTVYPQHVAGLILVGAEPGMWTDLGPSRQYDYISREEHDRMEAIGARLRQLQAAEGWSYRKHVQLIVYNNFLNGDWKRQHYYRPSPQKVAQIALHEWVQDERFRSAIGNTKDNVDLSGAFDQNPIPTLILEGKWDMTWGDAKPTILSRNHPKARMVVIENAAHSIYDENPDAFFTVLEAFLGSLSPVTQASRQRFARYLTEWRACRTESLSYVARNAGDGISGSRRLAEVYSRDKLDHSAPWFELTRIGFALYDVANHEEALHVFSVLERAAATRGDRGSIALGLIWQGHMLDLLGRREEALARYQRVLDLGYDGWMRHDQYGLRIVYLPHAAERLETPFRRVENTWP
ncbi:MAG: alpha/beta fold hydrolase [Gemmatimonadales bacterium]|nr:alpha/beta fold hydrolase [Gemmatimonadales bacterium]NIO31551.1 alpha/beta fold hydrolase [Gemmatimonadota bacterium]